MEKRVIVAAMLMAGLLMLYQTFFLSPTEPTKTEAPAKPAPGAPPHAPAPTPATPGVSPAAAAPAPVSAPAIPERAAEIVGPLYRATVSSRGGEFREWELNYRGRKPLVIPGLLGPTGLVVERAGSPAQLVGFQLSAQRLELNKEQPQADLILTGDDGFGLRISETRHFRADNYTVEKKIRVENRHSVAQTAELVMSWRAPVEWPKDRAEEFHGQHPVRVVGLLAEGLRREQLSKEPRRAVDGSLIHFSEKMNSAVATR